MGRVPTELEASNTSYGGRRREGRVGEVVTLGVFYS